METFARVAALLAFSVVSASTLAQAPAAGALPAGGPSFKFSCYGTHTTPDFKLSNRTATAQSIAIIFRDTPS